MFYDAESKMALDSQLQNEVAYLERHVLEAKKVELQKQLQALSSAGTGMPADEPATNPVGAKNSNLELLYENKG